MHNVVGQAKIKNLDVVKCRLQLASYQTPTRTQAISRESEGTDVIRKRTNVYATG